MVSERLSLAELNTKPPDYELAEIILRSFFPYPPINRSQARIMVHNYHLDPENFELPRRNTDLRNMSLVYWALSVLTCEEMGLSHKMDPKRFNRSFGRRLRKNRTGSRRG